MEVVLAEKYGFCAGVRVADKLVRIAAAKGQTGAILGQVVHNESVEREMASLGFPTVHRLEDARGHAGRIVFSAHGVAPSVRAEAASLGLEAVDTTCKFVTDIHREISRSLDDGCFIAVLGQKGHREVIGYTKDLDASRYGIFYDREEVLAFPWEEHPKVKVVFQTTLAAERFVDHVSEMRRRVPDLRIADTICYATKENQDALRALCADPSIDAIVVIGGRNSKNTKELVRIAEESKRTLFVGTAADLDPAAFAGVRKVGVTAGASTPDYDVEAVVERLRGIGERGPGPA